MSLGENIATLRKSLGLSQEQLAELLSVSRQAISKWETDQSVPELDKLMLLSDTFQISIDELLGRTAGNTPNSAGNGLQLKSYLEDNLRRRQLTLSWLPLLAGLLITVFILPSTVLRIWSAVSTLVLRPAGSAAASGDGIFIFISVFSVLLSILQLLLVAALIITGIKLIKRHRLPRRQQNKAA